RRRSDDRAPPLRPGRARRADRAGPRGSHARRPLRRTPRSRTAAVRARPARRRRRVRRSRRRRPADRAGVLRGDARQRRPHAGTLGGASMSVPADSSPTVTEVVRFEDLPLGSRGTRRAIARWSDGSKREALTWYSDLFGCLHRSAYADSLVLAPWSWRH